MLADTAQQPIQRKCAFIYLALTALTAPRTANIDAGGAGGLYPAAMLPCAFIYLAPVGRSPGQGGRRWAQHAEDGWCPPLDGGPVRGDRGGLVGGNAGGVGHK